MANSLLSNTKSKYNMVSIVKYLHINSNSSLLTSYKINLQNHDMGNIIDIHDKPTHFLHKYAPNSARKQPFSLGQSEKTHYPTLIKGTRSGPANVFMLGN